MNTNEFKIPENVLLIAKIKHIGIVIGEVKRETIKSKYPFYPSIILEPWFRGMDGGDYSLKLIEQWDYAENYEEVKEIGSPIENKMNRK